MREEIMAESSTDVKTSSLEWSLRLGSSGQRALAAPSRIDTIGLDVIALMAGHPTHFELVVLDCSI